LRVTGLGFFLAYCFGSPFPQSFIPSNFLLFACYHCLFIPTSCDFYIFSHDLLSEALSLCGIE
jgi:hypothetical protein